MLCRSRLKSRLSREGRLLLYRALVSAWAASEAEREGKASKLTQYVVNRGSDIMGGCPAAAFFQLHVKLTCLRKLEPIPEVIFLFCCMYLCLGTNLEVV